MTSVDSGRDATALDTIHTGLDVSFDGYAGPLDLLLDLTRDGKVDIRTIPVDEIASRFLDYIERHLASHDIDDVTEWLVMAAFLVQMKSRLLLPVASKERRDLDAGVEDLAERLRRLGAVRALAARMAEGRILGRDWHVPGGGGTGARTGLSRIDLPTLMRAYALDMSRAPAPPPAQAIVRHIIHLVTVKDAVRHLQEALATSRMVTFLEIVRPRSAVTSPIMRRSSISSAFVAVLGQAKLGKVDFTTDPDTDTIRSISIRLPDE
jgi:segregation and condensation protein A